MEQMTPFPPEGVAQGATNPPNPPRSANPSGNDGSGQLRAEALKLARLLDPAAFDDHAVPQNLGQRWDQYSRQQTAMDHATIALIRGYRLVVDDDTTVERVAAALYARKHRINQQAAGQVWSSLGPLVQEALREQARAAVRALRTDSQPAPSSSQAGSPTHHDCCPHCTAATGSCARCGVRDAADEEQLCGQCDTEVEAEVARERAVRALREEQQDVELCQGCGNPSGEGLHGMSEFGGCV